MYNLGSCRRKLNFLLKVCQRPLSALRTLEHFVLLHPLPTPYYGQLLFPKLFHLLTKSGFQRHPQVKRYRVYLEHQTYRRDYDLGLGMISGNNLVEHDSCSGCARWFAMLESLVRLGKPEKEEHSLCVLSMSRCLFVSECSRADISRVDVLSGMPSFIPSHSCADW